LAELGVTEILDNTFDVTCSAAVPEKAPEVAVIITESPAVTPVASPELLIDATLELEEVQATEVVMFFEVPSLYLPVALNC
jgi:hypothetical protein